MTRNPVRSVLFMAAFYAVSVLCCVLFLPGLLMPAPVLHTLIRIYLWLVTGLEYLILNLRYEIRGKENIPEQGGYIIAAKHQSAYETLKLHLLFDAPAVVLKKELLDIPLWGAFLKKADVIAIDRSTPTLASESIISEGRRVKDQGRPIIIFPQGTRVLPDETPATRKYKSGVKRLADATGLPVIPVALNSGLFWPKKGWLKSSGTVVFEFCPPVPSGLGKDDFMKKLESEIEQRTLSLMNEAREKAFAERKFSRVPVLFLCIALAIFGAYSWLWYNTAENIKAAYQETLDAQNHFRRTTDGLDIGGFPGPIQVNLPGEGIETPLYNIRIDAIKMSLWPLPWLHSELASGSVTFRHADWPRALRIDGAEITFSHKPDARIRLHDSIIRRGEFEMTITGTLDFSQQPIPEPDLIIAMRRHAALLEDLAEMGLIENRMALFYSAAFSTLAAGDGSVSIPLTQQNRRIFAGPVPVARLPEDPPPSPASPPYSPSSSPPVSHSDNPPAPAQ